MPPREQRTDADIALLSWAAADARKTIITRHFYKQHHRSGGDSAVTLTADDTIVSPHIFISSLSMIWPS